MQLRQASLFVPCLKVEWTVLVDEPVEAGASGPSVEPQDQRVLGRVPLGEDEVVVEALPTTILTNVHITAIVLGWESAVEAGEVSDERILGSSRGQ